MLAIPIEFLRVRDLADKTRYGWNYRASRNTNVLCEFLSQIEVVKCNIVVIQTYYVHTHSVFFLPTMWFRLFLGMYVHYYIYDGKTSWFPWCNLPIRIWKKKTIVVKLRKVFKMLSSRHIKGIDIVFHVNFMWIPWKFHVNFHINIV